MTERRSDKNVEVVYELVATAEWRELGESDVVLERVGECQRLQKMDFDYSDIAKQK